MTYNIRYDDQNNNPESWSQRKEQVVGLLRYHRPDIIGTQEGLKHQLEYIQDHLEGYERFGEGRRGGDEGEFSAILNRSDRFTVLRHQTFWLSDTPNGIGSKGWDVALQRIVAWGLLRDKQTGNVSPLLKIQPVQQRHANARFGSYFLDAGEMTPIGGIQHILHVQRKGVEQAG